MGRRGGRGIGVMKLARDERWKRGRDERWEGGTKMGARERDGRGRVGGGGPPISISLSSTDYLHA